jgi:hypothetical protein
MCTVPEKDPKKCSYWFLCSFKKKKKKKIRCFFFLRFLNTKIVFSSLMFEKSVLNLFFNF